MASQFNRAKRTQAIPPYLFFKIDELKREAIARGVDIINLGIGDPDLPTPSPIIQKRKRQVIRNIINIHLTKDSLRSGKLLRIGINADFRSN
jgi:aspartate/methionine/tyrosine aminotransferase